MNKQHGEIAFFLAIAILVSIGLMAIAAIGINVFRDPKIKRTYTIVVNKKEIECKSSRYENCGRTLFDCSNNQKYECASNIKIKEYKP